ncbi:hypothetical protein Q8A67_014967 [Cirrhinus molitorella]|uniref:Uncharacterized protein n=1 Tax=Cirrhinus molitorella TaxID=172907 RepID=A0AA88PNT2_9TELE|nr:hypothetical protein Q8A67_014967 [Cirrhinus molitorella]
MGASWTQSWKKEFKVHKLHLLTSKPELLLQPRWDIPPLLWLLCPQSAVVPAFSDGLFFIIRLLYILDRNPPLCSELLHSLININIHAINSIQTAVDLLLSATPVHLTHLCYAVLAGALYGIFAVVYWLMGGTNRFGQPYIYRVLDFSERPLVATLCILGVCLLCLPSCHFVMWNLHLLREWMVSREKARKIVLRREVRWWVNVSGGTTFDLVPSPDPTASVFETNRRTATVED